MIVCKKCGNQNEDGATFCGSCGTFLEWVGERVEEKQVVVVPETTEEEAAEPHVPGIIDRVKAAVGIGEATPTKEVEGARLPETPEGPAPEKQVVDLTGHEAAPPSPPRAESTAEAEATTPEKVTEEPGARKPELERQRPPPKTKSAATRARVRHGDLICGQCGEPNDPSRKFCRRCGSRLDTATVAKLPWWRRMFRRKPTPAPGVGGTAGEATRADRGSAIERARRARSGGLSIWTAIKRLLMFAALVGIFVGVAVNRTAIWDWIKDKISPPDLIHIERAMAKSELRSHPAEDAIDGVSTTYWAAGDTSSEGVGQFLAVDFGRRVSLEEVIIRPGNQEEPGSYAKQPAPAEIKLTYLDPRREFLEDDKCSLKAEAKEQSCSVDSDAENIRFVQITIQRVYSPSVGADAHVAITEVEFFGKVTTRED